MIRSLLSETVKIILTKMQVLVSTEPWEGVTSQLGKSFIVTLVYAYPINLGLMSSELDAWLK